MLGKGARQTDQLLASMERQLDRIYTALVVRDPGTSMSAEAYEGLRKSVVVSTSARRQHVAQLAEIDVALRRGARTEELLVLVNQWLVQAGVERIEDPDHTEVWERSLPTSNAVEVAVPAYIDLQTGGIVRQGRLRERVEKIPTSSMVREAAVHPRSYSELTDLGLDGAVGQAPRPQASTPLPEDPDITANNKISEEEK